MERADCPALQKDEQKSVLRALWQAETTPFIHSTDITGHIRSGETGGKAGIRGPAQLVKTPMQLYSLLRKYTHI